MEKITPEQWIMENSYTSYFYMIRFFKSNIIPLSTAVFDPQWFHKSNGNSYTFKDKNNVINGLRIDYLKPGKECDGLCLGPENNVACNGNPGICKFLKAYERQLLNINKREMALFMWNTAKKYNIENPKFAFIVHEAPWKQCSERIVLQKIFNIKEFNPETDL